MTQPLPTEIIGTIILIVALLQWRAYRKKNRSKRK